MLDGSKDINPDNTDLRPEGSGNRAFIIVGGILGVLIFLTLLAGVAYVLWIGPQLTAQRSAAQATVQAENALIAQQMTSTAEAALWSPTPEPTLTPSLTPTVPSKTPTVVSKTPTASSTPVVAANTPSMTATTDSVTLAAQQTELSQQMTSTSLALGTLAMIAMADTGLPTTGFFDQVGLPSLIASTLVLMIVIFLARRLRKAPSK